VSEGPWPGLTGDPPGGAGENASETEPSRTWQRFLPPCALIAGLSAWLWPIGVGGRMPVGGDVTTFQIGLMAVLREAIRAGRLPLWNDLWGFGFPGVAESQMGVFYPPHLLLYGLLTTEGAYTASLVLHTFWGGLGAMWAARRFGVSPWGSALSGFCWATCGFFVIHLPHQWGYTAGSWMPWAWGLGWSLLRGEGGPRTAWWLAAVLAIQILPGHFQLAFYTELGLIVMALAVLADRSAWGRGTFQRSVLVPLALVAAGTLAMMQVWPTFRLARLAESRRDYEYLSGFAATPLHLVSYVAPGLFHISPLWRRIAWDAFRTSPEEHLAYVGLVPLFLALGAAWHGLRRDVAARVLAVLALVTLVLSLGPYVPGFELWSRLPGFSFFRAPARWSLGSALALAILAGKGLDGLASWPKPGRRLAAFAVASLVMPLFVVLMFEVGLASTRSPGWPAVAGLYEWAFRCLPGTRDYTFRDLMAEARRPQGDLRVRTAQAREGLGPVPRMGLRLDRERSSIYARELGGTTLLVTALLGLSPFVGRRRWAPGALVALAAIDLWALGRPRGVDVAPIVPLKYQSPVLGQLALESRGLRTVDGLRNLPMVAGAAPLGAYRTLDLPALPELTRRAMLGLNRPEDIPRIVEAMRAAGAHRRILDPYEVASLKQSGLATALPGRLAFVDDPALASWMFGSAWVASDGSRATTFARWELDGEKPIRAWLLPLAGDELPDTMTGGAPEPRTVLEALKKGRPLGTPSGPERTIILVKAEGPAVVVVSQLHYPEWSALWEKGNTSQPAEILPVFGGWQAIRVPGPGDWILRLRYRGDDVRAGLAVSAVAWTAWLLTFFRPRRGASSVSTQPAARGPSEGQTT
jgi:hypothetical protein